MPRYVVSVRGEAREQFIVEADSEEDAKAKVLAGTCKPAIAEVHDPEIVSVEEIGKQG